MSKLTNSIKAQQKKTAENLVLVDLRNKGLVVEAPNIKRINGQVLSRLRDEWFVSDEGITCMGLSLLYNPNEGAKYLHNRLERAFLAGANAAVKELSKVDV